VSVAFGLPPALPFDVAINLGDVAVQDELRAAADGTRRLVVLQHGLWRSSASLGRVERALRAHGYDVLNPGYPSTSCTVQEAAALLHAAIEQAARAETRPVALAFVAHSMGGLVVQEYLRGPEARPPWACVYVGVPHRGAVLCDLRKHWWLFRLLMGDRSALQLSPGDPLHQLPIPCLPQSGSIAGDVGAGNDAIPGNDDGTIGVDEATLPGAADAITLDRGHTAIAGSKATVRQVLHFLRHGRFQH
jgi:pimeloyl-ACP methyl ester carboxylesterase